MESFITWSSISLRRTTAVCLWTCQFIERKRAQLINLILIKYKEAANCKTWMFHTSSAPRHGELYQSPVSRWTLKISVSNLCNHIWNMVTISPFGVIVSSNGRMRSRALWCHSEADLWNMKRNQFIHWEIIRVRIWRNSREPFLRYRLHENGTYRRTYEQPKLVVPPHWDFCCRGDIINNQSCKSGVKNLGTTQTYRQRTDTRQHKAPPTLRVANAEVHHGCRQVSGAAAPAEVGVSSVVLGVQRGGERWGEVQVAEVWQGAAGI